MKSTAIWALLLINAVLLVAFAWRLMPAKTAIAQQAPAPALRASDFLMLPVEVSGASSGIVVVLDQTNGQLGALSFDETSNTAGYMKRIDLRSIFQPGPGRSGTR